MERLKIIARMVNGIVSFDNLFAIDSILHIAAWNHSGRKQYWRENEGAQYALPLEKFFFDNERWCWAASFGIIHPVSQDAYYVNRRFTAERSMYLNPKIKRISVSGGRFRGYRIPLARIYTPVVEWYVIGDSVQIETLLNEIQFIGKKHQRGCGEVLRWKIQKSDINPILNDGRLMRSVPADWANKKKVSGQLVRPGKLLPPYNPKSDTTFVECLFP